MLERKARAAGVRIEAFNLALPGWTVRQERAAYERLARPYRPDLVLLGVCLNDIPELYNQAPEPVEALVQLHRHSALVRRLIQARGREIRDVRQLFTRPDDQRTSEAVELLLSELRELRREVESDSARLALLVFPFRFQLEADAPPPRVQERLVRFGEAERVPVVDLQPALQRAGLGAFHDHSHLSPLGAQAVADEVLSRGDLALSRAAWPGILSAQLGRPDPEIDSFGVAELSAALRTGPDPVRAAAAWALGRSTGGEGRGRDVVAGLATALRDRSEAARALGGIGGDARPALGALMAALDDPRETVRWEAAGAAWAAGVAALDPLELSRRLDHPDPYVAFFTKAALGSIGARAVPVLVEALDGDAAAVRRASRVLVELGQQDPQVVQALIGAFGDSRAGVRAQVARILGRIGPAAASAVRQLERAQSDPATGEAASRALERIEGR